MFGLAPARQAAADDGLTRNRILRGAATLQGGNLPDRRTLKTGPTRRRRRRSAGAWRAGPCIYPSGWALWSHSCVSECAARASKGVYCNNDGRKNRVSEEERARRLAEMAGAAEEHDAAESCSAAALGSLLGALGAPLLLRLHP